MPGLTKLTPESAIRHWNDLILSSPGLATIAHNPHFFSFFSDYLSLLPYYFILKEKDNSIGFLPVVKAGNRFISMPHFSYGGIYFISKASIDEEELIQMVLVEIENQKPEAGFYAVDLSQLKPGSFDSVTIEMRSEKPFFENKASTKTRHFIYLEKTTDEQLHLFSSHLRRKINKARRNGIEIKIGKEELLDDFVKVYCKNMHKLGSPAFGKDFFEALLRIHGTDARIFVAYYFNKPVGAAFCLDYFGFVENVWFSTLAKFNHLYTAYLLHWSIMEQAIADGKKVYSLGRSTTGSGVHQFKKQWSAEEKPLYFSKNKTAAFSLKDQKWLAKIWKLLPPQIVNQLGPRIAKRIY